MDAEGGLRHRYKGERRRDRVRALNVKQKEGQESYFLPLIVFSVVVLGVIVFLLKV